MKNQTERRPSIAGINLVGEKVVLREKKLDDAVEDYVWRRDSELSELDATRPISMSFSDYHRYTQEELRYDSYYSVRLAVDTLDGIHIGNCMYYDINDRRQEAELGIMIGNRDYWSQGYGSDAIKTLIDEQLAKNARTKGAYLMSVLKDIQSDFSDKIKVVRGKGLLTAFEMYNE